MRHSMRWLAVGLITLAAPALASAADEGATCGTYGTRVEFEKSPSLAAKRAAKEEKLVMVLHISGIFEDPGLT
jgi:hypothetical protein